MGSETVRNMPVVEVAASGDQPTKAEMEEDVSIDATPEGVERTLFAGDPLVVTSGKGRKSTFQYDTHCRRRPGLPVAVFSFVGCREGIYPWSNQEGMRKHGRNGSYGDQT